MAGKFRWSCFDECDLNDDFFDSLRMDYPEFDTWFKGKSDNREPALVFTDEVGIGAFLYLKSENEALELTDLVLPARNRLKIGTLKLAERYQGQRLGEGAMGIALWRWQALEADEVYITVFEKHKALIDLLERFGFILNGKNVRGENVYLKSRNNIEFADPYKVFPFVNPLFNKAGMVPIDDRFHDILFPYSELFRTTQEFEETAAANGVTKVFIASPTSVLQYGINDPVIIYRKHTGEGQKGFKSVATCFCTVTRITVIKNNNVADVDLVEFIRLSGNKTVYTNEQLEDFYNNRKNLILIELLYNGFFGKGKNINFYALKDNGLFEDYPYNIRYTKDQFKSILEMGGKNVQNVIINQS